MFGFLIGLISTGGILAGRGSLLAGGVTTLGQSPPTPKKEYIYSGGKLIAIEEATTGAPATPAAPTNLTATANAINVSLSWSDNSDETHFVIHRKTGASGSYGYLGEVGQNVTTYTDGNVTSGATYYYTVYSERRTTQTQRSAPSNEASATIPAGGPLAAPSNLTAETKSSSQIDLIWTEQNSNEQGFEIERKTGMNGTYSRIATVGANVARYSSTGLSPLTEYVFRVRAYDALGKSDYSGEAAAKTYANLSAAGPPAPTNLTATVTTAGVSLLWTDNSDETHFVIKRKVGPNGSYSYLGEVGQNITSYTDNNVAPSATYYYTAYAEQRLGSPNQIIYQSLPSNEASITTPNCEQTAPAAPSEMRWRRYSTGLQVSWKDNSSDETGFIVERRYETDSVFTQIANTPANAIFYTDQSFPLTGTYFYRVKAYNCAGSSGYATATGAYITSFKIEVTPNGDRVAALVERWRENARQPAKPRRHAGGLQPN